MDIRLCGRLAVEHGGHPLQERLPGRQGRLLLAYLALSGGRGASRDELIEAVWQERPPAHPEAALSTTLSRLRGALPEGAIEGRGQLSLRLGTRDRLDVRDAEAALQRARAAAARGDWEAAEEAARRVLQVARAPLLPGHEAPWLDDWRRRLGDLAVEALEVCAAAGVRRAGGDVAAAEGAAHELVEREPYRESGYLRLMEVQAARGNMAEALRVYEQLRTLLRDELGTAPGPSVKALHEQLLRGEAFIPTEDSGPASAPPATGLPSPAESTPLPALLARLRDKPLVGREAELAHLAAAWQEAVRAQQRRILFLAGEPGIGKTSLAAHFARQASAGGAIVLYGRADPEALIPYQPFAEALRHLALNAPLATLRASAPDLVELSRLVPEFRRRLPDLPPPPERSRDDDRYRLFSAAAALLAEAAHQAPVLLVLDDLHWADRSSLQLLRHIARHSDPAPLLILATYRDTDLHRSPQLAEALADLRREHLDERIPLTGLDEEAVGKLVADATDAASCPLCEAIHQETRGNPFFVVEMLRQLADVDTSHWDGEGPEAATLLARVGVPEGVREVIEARVSSLSDPAREALTLAAVLGQEFELDALAAVAGSEPSDVEGPLEEALEATLLIEVEGMPGRLGFSHALVRETLYRRPSAMRRAQLHRRAGEALEALFSENLDAHAAELAHHLLAAGARGDADKAIRYSVAAAEQATARLAHEEAAAHYGRVLELVDSGAERCELLLALGEAHWSAGDLEKARKAYFEAAELAEKRDDSVRLAYAALGFAGPPRLEVAGAVTGPVVALLKKALAAFGGEESALRARVMARLAAALAYSRMEERQPALGSQALKLARRVGDKAALADALAAAWFAHGGPDHLEERLRMARELSPLALELGHGRCAALAHSWASADLLELGDIEASEREVAALERLAEALGQRYPKFLVAAIRARRAYLEGRLADLEALAPETAALGLEGQDEDAVLTFRVQMVALRLEQGRLHELLEGIQALAEQYPGLPGWRCALAVAYAELGRRVEAQRELEVLARADFTDLPRDVLWLLSVSLLSEVVAFLEDTPRAEPLYELLLPYADHCVVAGQAHCHGSASRPLGLLATTLSRFEAGVRHFEDALEMNARIKSPLWVAHTQHEYARMLLRRGGEADSEKGLALLGEALATAEELALTALADRARLLKLRPEAATSS